MNNLDKWKRHKNPLIRAQFKRMKSKKSNKTTWSKDATLKQLDAAGLPAPVCEYRFHPVRRWRADFAWPLHKVILEVEGGTWVNGRHTRGSGFNKDREKYNAAAALGFLLLRTIPDELPGKKRKTILPTLVEDLRLALSITHTQEKQ